MSKRMSKQKCQQDYSKVSVRLEKKKDHSTKTALSSYLFKFYPPNTGASPTRKENSQEMY